MDDESPIPVWFENERESIEQGNSVVLKYFVGREGRFATMRITGGRAFSQAREVRLEQYGMKPIVVEDPRFRSFEVLTFSGATEVVGHFKGDNYFAVVREQPLRSEILELTETE